MNNFLVTDQKAVETDQKAYKATKQQNMNKRNNNTLPDLSVP